MTLKLSCQSLAAIRASVVVQVIFFDVMPVTHDEGAWGIFASIGARSNKRPAQFVEIVKRGRCHGFTLRCYKKHKKEYFCILVLK